MLRTRKDGNENMEEDTLADLPVTLDGEVQLDQKYSTGMTPVMTRW